MRKVNSCIKLHQKRRTSLLSYKLRVSAKIQRDRIIHKKFGNLEQFDDTVQLEGSTKKRTLQPNYKRKRDINMRKVNGCIKLHQKRRRSLLSFKKLSAKIQRDRIICKRFRNIKQIDDQHEGNTKKCTLQDFMNKMEQRRNTPSIKNWTNYNFRTLSLTKGSMCGYMSEPMKGIEKKDFTEYKDIDWIRRKGTQVTAYEPMDWTPEFTQRIEGSNVKAHAQMDWTSEFP